MHSLRGPFAGGGGTLSPLLLALALAGCGGSQTEPATPPTSSTQSDQSDLPPDADDTPTLDVTAAKPTEILLDGKPIGTTPISAHKVTPGLHEVTFVDEARGNRTMMVTFEPGDNKTVQADPVPPIQEMGGGEEKKEEKK